MAEDFCTSGGLCLLYPFAGSGSTLVAVGLAARRYPGIELEEKHRQLARRRLVGVDRYMRRSRVRPRAISSRLRQLYELDSSSSSIMITASALPAPGRLAQSAPPRRQFEQLKSVSVRGFRAYRS